MKKQTAITADQAYKKAKLINDQNNKSYGREMWLKYVEPQIISTINKGEFECKIVDINHDVKTPIDWNKVAMFGRNLGYSIRTNVCTLGKSYVLYIKFPEPEREIDYLEGNRG